MPLSVQAEGVQEELRLQLAEVGRLQQAALAKGHRQEAALQQARQETLEAVQQGNQKYAMMLAERMSVEDELKHQLSTKQQAAATRSVAMHIRGHLLLSLSFDMPVAELVCSAATADWRCTVCCQCCAVWTQYPCLYAAHAWALAWARQCLHAA